MPEKTKNVIINRCCKAVSVMVAVGTLPLLGCTVLTLNYGPDGQSREAFEQRVEAAFRLQNNMTSEVMVLQADGLEPIQLNPVIQAEQSMASNCAYLNEYVSRDVDGKSKSIALLRNVKNSVSACESATEKVKVLLRNYPH